MMSPYTFERIGRWRNSEFSSFESEVIVNFALLQNQHDSYRFCYAFANEYRFNVQLTFTVEQVTESQTIVSKPTPFL